MAVSPDLLFQNLSTVHSVQQPTPTRFTAAATIAPTTFLSFVTGTTSITTITPPTPAAHTLAIVVLTTNFSGFASSGNIAAASITNSTTWGTRVSYFSYDPVTAKYYPLYGVTLTNA